MIKEKLKEFYKKANQISGGRLAILKNALASFSDVRASQAAASLAYYAILSLFPLLLVMISAGSYFLDSEQVQQFVTDAVKDIVLVSPQMINENLDQVLKARGTVGLLGLFTLLWSASGFFANLAYHVNLAWADQPRRNFLAKRLVGLAMILGLGGLLLLSLVLEWATTLIPFLKTANQLSAGVDVWRLVSSLSSWMIILLMFVFLYRWVPVAEIAWRTTLVSSLVISVGWKIATAGFNWYVNSGFSQYQLIYGSLGTIVTLLLLIYYISLITLFGAHLSAAIDQWKNEEKK